MIYSGKEDTMLKNCKEEDFYELKCVAEDRMRPDAIPVFLWAAAIISLLPSIFLMVIAIKTNSALWWCLAVLNILFFTVQLVNACFFTSIKRCFKFQKYGAIATCISAFVVSIDFYFIFYCFAVFEAKDKFLTIAGLFLMLGGFVFLIASTIRAIKRVEQGALRKGGKLLYDFQQREGKVNVPLIYALTVLGGALARVLTNNGGNKIFSTIFLMTMSAFIQYGMALALPEFFLMIYCKFRFDSFIVEMPPDVIEELKKPKKGFKDLKKALKITTIITLIIMPLSFIGEELSDIKELVRIMFYFYIGVLIIVYLLIKIKNKISKFIKKFLKDNKSQKRRYKR